MFDVLVIGGGVVGGLILRELTKYNLSVCMVEKSSDVCMGASKANSGIVHAGFDAKIGSLKAKFNVLGNALMYKIAKELGVKCVNNGSLVVAYSSEEISTLKELKERGKQNGVTGLEILNAEELFKLEPNLSKKAIGALYAKSAGIVCPYELTIASIGNAMDNGAKLELNFEVSKITKTENGYVITSSNGKEIESKLIINCAGYGSQKIANLVGDFSFKIGARRGEYILLDRESKDFVNHTIFCTPTKRGKGILITQTVDGNILLGPTAEEIENAKKLTRGKGLGLSRVQNAIKQNMEKQSDWLLGHILP